MSSKLCEYLNCKERADYGYNYGVPMRCFHHKEDMKLQYMICHCGKSIPCYNLLGLRAEYCESCKLNGMIDIVNK